MGNTVVPVPSVGPPPAPSEVSGFAQIPTAPGATWATVASAEPLPGLVVVLRLPATTFLAGEAISPQVRVRNTGQDPVAIYDPWIEALDQDTSLSLVKPTPFLPGSWPETHPPPSPWTVDPGQTHVWSRTIQLPFADQAAARSPYRLRAVAQLSGPDPVPKNLAEWPTFQTASVPLTLVPARPQQQLRLAWQADRHQWCVQAVDGAGGRPVGPLVAWMHATSAHGGTCHIRPRWDTRGPHGWHGRSVGWLLDAVPAGRRRSRQRQPLGGRAWLRDRAGDRDCAAWRVTGSHCDNGRVSDVREWAGALTFRDVGAIVYHVKVVAWLVPGFSVATHARSL